MLGRKRLDATRAQRIEISQIRINRVFVQGQDLTREFGRVSGFPDEKKDEADDTQIREPAAAVRGCEKNHARDPGETLENKAGAQSFSILFAEVQSLDALGEVPPAKIIP